MIRLLLVLVMALPLAAGAAAPANAPRPPAKVMLLGLFHFDNPGLDAVKYTPIDVMQPAPQTYLGDLSKRLAAFAPTKVLLEYPGSRDEEINKRYAAYRQGRFELPKNEIYQIGFRVAHQAGLAGVNGFDIPAPVAEEKLWGYLDQVPEDNARLLALIDNESRRLQRMHRSGTLEQVLVASNSDPEDRRNKGFYMLLNPVGAAQGLFHGADASANWWHRNLRMYAVIQRHAVAGERVLVIAGSGHTAILRDFMRADAERVEEPVLHYLQSPTEHPPMHADDGD